MPHNCLLEKTRWQYDVLYPSTFLTTLVLGDCRDYPCARGLSRPPSCSGTVQTTIMHGDCPDHHRARGLSRPPSCSGTIQATIMHGDCPDHHRARGLSQPPSCSGTKLTTVILEDSSFFPCCDRGLPQPLSDHCSETALLGYM